MQDISAFIITFNEERHIGRAIENARRYARRVYVLDSFSDDRTCEIAESLGARVYRRKFTYHADQLNWGLDNIPFETEWIWRQDADEYLTDALIDEIDAALAVAAADVCGFTARRQIKFLGRAVTHGVMSVEILRLFRRGRARFEDKRMDEHAYVVGGRVGRLSGVFYDDSLLSLSEWTQKHNAYATKEASDLLCAEYGVRPIAPVLGIGARSEAVRRNKMRYARLPLFWRPLLLFAYRYFLRGGFLDGKEGFLWHILQGFWYRTLADAKVYEVKKRFDFDKERIMEFLSDKYLTPPPEKLTVSRHPVALMPLRYAA